MATGKVFLIPTVLQDDDRAFQALPPYILDAIKSCNVYFAENIKTTRRYFKRWWKEMEIDAYGWIAIHKVEEATLQEFRSLLQAGSNIGIISEAGCPGIADPGQQLIQVAQQMGIAVQPLVGPNSILLALMASGMNGQRFQFCGYLPIEKMERKKAIIQLEADSKTNNCTQIFIETPYRNNALMDDILSSCHLETRLCIGVDITAATESIKTHTIRQWREKKPNLHKRPAIFLILGS